MSIRNGGGGSRLAGGGGGAPGGVTLVSPGSRHTTNSTVLGVVRRTSRASCNKLHREEIKNLIETDMYQSVTRTIQRIAFVCLII